jgi:hypothetical protein
MNNSTHPPVHQVRTKKMRVIGILSWCCYGGIGAYALLAVFGYLGGQVFTIDESLQLVASREVLEGRTPFRDFYSLYPPLTYYLNALAFRAWSSSFMVARFVSVVIFVLTAVSVARYVSNALKAQSFGVRWAAAGLTVFCLTRVLPYSCNNAVYAAILVLTHFLSVLDRRAPPSRRTLLICGLLTGVVATMRLNVGLYLIAAIGASLATTDEMRGLRALSRALRRLLTFAAPICVVWALLLLPYGRAAKDVIAQIALTPNLVLRAGHITDASGNPGAYGSLFALVACALLGCRIDWRSRSERMIAISLAAVTMGLTALGFRLLSATHLLVVPYAIPGLLLAVLIAGQLFWRRFPPNIFVAVSFSLASLQYYLIRADSAHLAILGGAAALLVATLIQSQPQLTRLAIFGTLFCLMMQFPLPIGRVGVAQWIWPVNPNLVLPAVRVIFDKHSFLALGDVARLNNGEALQPFERHFFPDHDEHSVIRYVDRVASQNESIFMGLTSHDRTRVNDSRLSWMMPRRLASRYLEIEPGIITSESVQREVVQSLRTGVRWLVLQDTASTGTARYPYPQATVLDQYIAANYERAASFGQFHVYCRHGACSNP